jgi:peptidyl-prolyl cis-trans isomerase D
MEAAFKLTSSSPVAPTPFKIGNRWYAIRLKTRSEAPRAEFDKIKEQIKQKILPKKQEEALAAWVKDLKSKAKIEINPILLAEK